jgi:hypothetical protein
MLIIVVKDGVIDTPSPIGDARNRISIFAETQHEKQIVNQIEAAKKQQYQLKYGLWELKN